ncbi:MAG: protein-L-isoaspartate(D-aspartate) O-methyltransferase [Deltaproteobacteria bacterium]|nr:protein-L-isoaspartate(D-aspartate) O-methyltransferase [Deltaproteobacteria bacterium]
MASHQKEQLQTLAWQTARSGMVEQQLANRGVDNPRVLAAMAEVPRHRFVPDDLQAEAYRDHPLPIGYDQTISQPYIVALMAELLDPKGNERVLEIGTGSGYHAAVLSRVVEEVYSIEIVEELGVRASRVLAELGYDNIHSRIGDGYRGWQEAAPFDAIILTAAPARVPEPLVAQLRLGGRLVLPLGETSQDLQVLTKTESGLERQVIAPVRFVPMTGEILEGAGG